MKLTFLSVVVMAAGAFGATVPFSQPAQQQTVIEPYLFRLSLQPQLVPAATQPSTTFFIVGHQVTILSPPHADQRGELLPLPRPGQSWELVPCCGRPKMAAIKAK
jgi:hypothetical protein